MARISKVIYGKSLKLFMIKAVISVSVFWHGSSWRCDGEKGKRIWGFVGDPSHIFYNSSFQILDFSDFQPLLYQVWIVPRL